MRRPTARPYPLVMPNQRRRVATVAALLLAVALVVTVFYRGFFVVPYDLRIIRQDIPCAGPARESIRVLLLSDVDFPRYRSNLDRAADAARTFDPDLVLVAGDFLDRASTLKDPGIRQAAQAWFEGLPARGRRLLAPGEAESPALELLRASWSPEVIEPVANESRRFEIRGERLDVFVADQKTDPAPWSVQKEGDRWTARARCRATETYVQLAKPDAQTWDSVEVTLALRLAKLDGRVLVRLASDPAADPRVGDALVVVYDKAYPGFRFHGRWQGDRKLSGRAQSRYVPPTGVWFRCRIRFLDEGNATRVQARFWTEGDAEPKEWMIDASASGPNRRRKGTIAFGGERASVQFADLIVTDSSGQPLFRDAFDDEERFRADWKQWSRLGAWLASSPDGAMRLLVSHTPDIALDVAELGGVAPAAILAGHTHGGQVSLPWLGPVYTDSRLGRKYDRGLFRFAGTPLFITAGVGTPPVDPSAPAPVTDQDQNPGLNPALNPA